MHVSDVLVNLRFVDKNPLDLLFCFEASNFERVFIFIIYGINGWIHVCLMRVFQERALNKF